MQTTNIKKVFLAMVDMNVDKNDADKEHSQVDETDNSCRFEFFEIVPLIRYTDHNYARVCDRGEWTLSLIHI